MAWYGNGGWDYYPPYMSVADKKAHGARALAKLLRKSKRTAEPVVIAHRKRQLTITFWGKAWSANLERYADLANRLPRGRAYLRNGSVLDLAIAGGRVEAHVAGSELYRVTIGIAPMAKARWRRVVARCTGRIGSLVGLLRGELSDDVLAAPSRARARPRASASPTIGCPRCSGSSWRRRRWCGRLVRAAPHAGASAGPEGASARTTSFKRPPGSARHPGHRRRGRIDQRPR